MKKKFLGILTSFLLFSSVANPLYVGNDSWKTALYSFLNDNKKYIGYGSVLFTAGGLMYSGYKKTGTALLALAAGLPFYSWYTGNKNKVPSVASLRKSLQETKEKSKKYSPVEVSNESNESESKIQNKSFDTWYEECTRFPHYSSSKKPGNQGIRKHVLGSVLDAFIKSEKKHLNEVKWIDSKFNPNNDEFQPFVQKLEVRLGDIIAFHGDLHGDVHSLLESIKDLSDKGYMDSNNPFKIIKRNFKLVFLGDYVDRGWYGAEVIYTILRLKLENPDQVFLVRGNHEDIMINSNYGFLRELEKKWNMSNLTEFVNKIETMYSLLPVALYIGSTDQSGKKDFIQCCHGGLEIGHNPQGLLKSKADYELLENLYIRQNLLALSLSEEERSTIEARFPEIYQNNDLTPQQFISEGCPFGYQWNDFEVDPKIFLSYGRSLKCGKDFTRKVLDKHSSKTHRVQGVFRAHQHSGDLKCNMMKRITNADKQGHDDDRGCGKLWIPEGTDQQGTKKLWPGIVCTFSVSPNTPYKPALRGIGETYGLLKIKSGFEKWELEMVRLNEQKRQDVTEEG